MSVQIIARENKPTLHPALKVTKEQRQELQEVVCKEPPHKRGKNSLTLPWVAFTMPYHIRMATSPCNSISPMPGLDSAFLCRFVLWVQLSSSLYKYLHSLVLSSRPRKILMRNTANITVIQQIRRSLMCYHHENTK